MASVPVDNTIQSPEPLTTPSSLTIPQLDASTETISQSSQMVVGSCESEYSQPSAAEADAWWADLRELVQQVYREASIETRSSFTNSFERA